jgi:hypothetical protein
MADSFYRRWIVANSWSEGVGLGATLLLALLAAPLLEERPGTLTILVGAAIAVALGTLLEGVLVGVAQGMVLRRALPDVPLSRWTGGHGERSGRCLAARDAAEHRHRAPAAVGWPASPAGRRDSPDLSLGRGGGRGRARGCSAAHDLGSERGPLMRGGEAGVSAVFPAARLFFRRLATALASVCRTPVF